jgi:hypothetical protein
MPRYFFNVEDHRTAIDVVGTELPDLNAARDEAVVMSGEILRGGGVPVCLGWKALADVGYGPTRGNRQDAIHASIFGD